MKTTHDTNGECGKARRIVRQMESDGEHLWLRQAVTFTTAEGQTRTVEIAIPLRPGASEEEIDALLQQADLGMEHISRHLNERVATLLTASIPSADTSLAPVPASTLASDSSDAMKEVEPDEAPASATTRQPSTPAPIAEGHATPTRSPLPRDTSASTPTPAANQAAKATNRAEQNPISTTSAPPASPNVAPIQRGPARPTSASTTAHERTSRPSPSTPTPARPPQPSHTTNTEQLTLPAFLAQTQAEFGLNPKQVMERLGVRSLSGLNLREALETLRRRELRADEAHATSSPTPPASTSAATPPTALHFDEEDDDLAMTFSVEEGDTLLDDEFVSYGADANATRAWDTKGDFPDDLEEDDLDDVPNFGPPPSAHPQQSASRRGSIREAPPIASSPAPEAQGNSVAAERSRALQLLGQMRSARSGGAPSSQQRNAYRNIIEQELGEQDAAALVRGIWKLPPTRLGADQFDELISWGKRDTFAEEAMLVLAVLKDERIQAQETPSQSPTPPVSGSGQSNSRSRGVGASNMTGPRRADIRGEQ